MDDHGMWNWNGNAVSTWGSNMGLGLWLTANAPYFKEKKELFNWCLFEREMVILMPI